MAQGVGARVYCVNCRHGVQPSLQREVTDLRMLAQGYIRCSLTRATYTAGTRAIVCASYGALPDAQARTFRAEFDAAGGL